MGFIFSLEDKSNEWSTEDKLNVLSTAVSYASPSQGFHSLFGSFIEESFDEDVFIAIMVPTMPARFAHLQGICFCLNEMRHAE